MFSDIVAYVEACITLAYSEPCHIQNPGIFRIQDLFRTLPRHILAYSKRCVTLACWEPCHIPNFPILRILACLGPKEYSEPCVFRHIQAYSIMIVIITLTFIFHFKLTYFSKTFKRHLFFDYNDVNFNARLSLLK